MKKKTKPYPSLKAGECIQADDNLQSWKMAKVLCATSCSYKKTPKDFESPQASGPHFQSALNNTIR